MNKTEGIILVVDDQENNRSLLDRALSRKGYEVICKESGPDALLHLQENTVDLVLLDVMMPELDGYEVLDYIRQTTSAMDLPIIMAGSHGFVILEEQGAQK